MCFLFVFVHTLYAFVRSRNTNRPTVAICIYLYTAEKYNKTIHPFTYKLEGFTETCSDVVPTLTFCKYLRNNIEQRREILTEWELGISWWTSTKMLRYTYRNSARKSTYVNIFYFVLILKLIIYIEFICLPLVFTYKFYTTKNTLIPHTRAMIFISRKCIL